MPVHEQGGVSVRQMILAARDHNDPDAFQTLLTLVHSDICGVVGARLRHQPRLIDGTVADVRVRIFVQMHQFKEEVGWFDAQWERNFRVWCVQLARRYAANVSRQGLERARENLIPRGDGLKPRRVDLVYMSGTDESMSILHHHHRNGR